MAIKKISINDFSTGMIPSQRSDELGAASVIKNFDIYQDPKKLIPVTAWEDFATEAEENYGIQTLGGANQGNETIYGLGRANTAWFSDKWNRRVLLTAASTGGEPAYMLIDLSNFGADFWDNVLASGADVRVTDTNHNPVQMQLINFDTGTETGHILVRTDLQNLYVYWDNADATSGSQTSNSYLWGGTIAADSFYTLDGNRTDYEGSWNLDDSGSYVDGGGVLLGQGHGGGDIYTDNGGAGALHGGDDATVGFIFKGTDKTGGLLVRDDYGMFELELNTNGTVNWIIQNETTTRTGANSTTDICDGNVHHVLMTYVNGVMSLYIDGTQEVTTDYTADLEDLDGSTSARLIVNARGNAIEYLEYGDHQTNSTIATALGTMVADNASFWTIGTYETYNSANDTFGGVALYTKGISDTEWTPLNVNKMEVRSTTYYPIHGFLLYNNYFQFVTTTAGENSFGSTEYLTQIQTFGADHINWTAATNVASTEAMPRLSYPVDKKYYFNRSSAMSSINSLTYTATAFSPYATPECHTPYDQYLAIGSDLGGKSVIQLWDMDSNLARALIDLGTGNVRVVGNVFGTIFAVVNNSLADDDLGAGDQSMDIRVWTGGAEARPWISFKSPTSYDGEFTPENWKQPVNNQVEYFKHGMVFWGKVYDIDNNEMEGLWAIGKNERNGKFGLTMLRDMAGMGDVSNIYRTGNNLLVCHGYDGAISKSSSATYTANSVWQSTWLMGSGNDVEDQLKEVEVTFDPLDAGQTVTIEIRTDGGSWTTIATITETGAVHRTATLIESTEVDFPAFRELQIRVTSTGGAAPITGVHYTYEELSND